MPFLIIGFQRTGTGMLTSALNGHPEIWCEDEIEQPSRLKQIVEGESCKKIEPLKKGKSFERYFTDKAFSSVRVWGANIKYSGLRRLMRKESSLLKQFKIIHLVRDSVLHTILSVIVNCNKAAYGIQPHEYNVVTRKKKILLQEPEIEQIKVLQEHIPKEQDFWTGYFKTLHDKEQILELTYENIAPKENSVPPGSLLHHHCVSLCQFLGVTFFPLKPLTVKTGESVLDMVENPEVLAPLGFYKL